MTPNLTRCDHFLHSLRVQAGEGRMINKWLVVLRVGGAIDSHFTNRFITKHAQMAPKYQYFGTDDLDFEAAIEAGGNEMHTHTHTQCCQ